MTKRTYEMRPWGRPLGLATGVVALSFLLGPVMEVLRRGSAFGRVEMFRDVAEAGLTYLTDNVFELAMTFGLIWWWLTFAKYRSRTAFAIAGVLWSAYPLALQYGRYVAFADDVSEGDQLVLAVILGVFAATGAIAMLFLHFVAYRRIKI